MSHSSPTHASSPTASSGNRAALSMDQLRRLCQGDIPVAENVMALFATLRSPDEELRSWASDALETLTRPEATLLPQLAVWCRDREGPVAYWACKLLGRLADKASDYQSALVEGLETHPMVGVRQSAAAALAQIPKLDEKSLAALRRAASSQDPRLARLASSAAARGCTAVDDKASPGQR